MKRTITPVQRLGMNLIIPMRVKHAAPPSCAFCRHSHAEPGPSGWSIECELGMALDARECPHFRDARKNLDPNYLRTQ